MPHTVKLSANILCQFFFAKQIRAFSINQDIADLISNFSAPLEAVANSFYAQTTNNHSNVYEITNNVNDTVSAKLIADAIITRTSLPTASWHSFSPDFNYRRNI